MTNQNNRGNAIIPGLSSLISRSKAKGGTSKTSIDSSIEDAIVQMAEAHVMIVLKAAQFEEFSEVKLSASITVVLDQVLALLLPSVTTDIRSQWEKIYKETFWQVLQSARK